MRTRGSREGGHTPHALVDQASTYCFSSISHCVVWSLMTIDYFQAEKRRGNEREREGRYWGWGSGIPSSIYRTRSYMRLETRNKDSESNAAVTPGRVLKFGINPVP